MLVKWNLQKRIAAIAVLKSLSRASLFEWRIAKEGIKSLEITKEEMEHYKMVRQQNGDLQWDTDLGKVEKEYLMSNGAYNVMKIHLEIFDKQRALHPDLYELAEEVLGWDSLDAEQKKLLEMEKITPAEAAAREKAATEPKPKKAKKNRRS